MSGNGVEVQSIAFSQGGIEIVYVEERDVDEKTGIMVVRTLVCPTKVVEEHVDDILDSARQLVDAAEVARRNPRMTK